MGFLCFFSLHLQYFTFFWCLAFSRCSPLFSTSAVDILLDLRRLRLLSKSGSLYMDPSYFTELLARHVYKKIKWVNTEDERALNLCLGIWGKQILFKAIMNNNIFHGNSHLLKAKLNFLKHLVKMIDVFVHCIERNNQTIIVILIRRWEGQKTW